MPINIPTIMSFLGASALAGLLGIGGTVPMEQARSKADTPTNEIVDLDETDGKRSARVGHRKRQATQSKRQAANKRWAKNNRKSKKRTKAKKRKQKRRGEQRQRDRQERKQQKSDERLLRPDFGKRKHRTRSEDGGGGPKFARGERYEPPRSKKSKSQRKRPELAKSG